MREYTEGDQAEDTPAGAGETYAGPWPADPVPPPPGNWVRYYQVYGSNTCTGGLANP